MADFNIIVPEIGGVDTSDPWRQYSCDEQFSIVSAIFGEGIELPNQAGLLTVARRSSGKGYSSTTGKIYVANDGEERDLIASEQRGFLFIATGAALNAGRLAFRASLGDQAEVKKHKSEDFKYRQDFLTSLLLDSRVLLDLKDSVSGDEEDRLDVDLAMAVKQFLGELWYKETRIGPPYGGPYQTFTYEVLRRLKELKVS
jgi:hypothetical protein